MPNIFRAEKLRQDDVRFEPAFSAKGTQTQDPYQRKMLLRPRVNESDGSNGRDKVGPRNNPAAEFRYLDEGRASELLGSVRSLSR